ncbi:MAG: hypothetical protein KDB62_02475 [Solirubrobacterales bacterium]|nr:hypothetical protein [Solirubrobacterales bacterium]
MSETGTRSNRDTARLIATGILTTVLLVGLMLTAGGLPARAYELRSVQITSYMSGTGGGGIYAPGTAQGLVVAKQNGRTSGKGARPMGIIAILIGLKAEQKYGLAFSTRRCTRGAGGLVGKGVRFTASSEGKAVVKRNYRLQRKVLRRARSMVLLSPETGRRFQACGPVRVATGDVNRDGTGEIITG